MWQVNIISFFPDLFPGPLSYSVIGRSLKNRIWSLNTIDLKKFAIGKHKTIDDTSYGGGSGMILRPDVLASAIDYLNQSTQEFSQPSKKIPLVYLSPRGKVFNQIMAKDLVKNAGITIICGRFEGIDERIFSEYQIEEISLGDYVLSCGDIAAFSLLDSCIRLLPGVLSDDHSVYEESFGENNYENLLEYPQYTKPFTWRNHEVPNVLISGNHNKIKKWRLQEAENKTRIARTDLWNQYLLKNYQKK